MSKKSYIKPAISVKEIKLNLLYFSPFRAIEDGIDNLYHADKLLAQDGCSCCASCSGGGGCGSCGGACS